MTTRCLALVSMIGALACASSPSVSPPVGTSQQPQVSSRELRASNEGMRAQPAQTITERRERGFEVYRGTGYGHPIPGVNSKAVSVYADTREGLTYYCDREPLQANVEFEIAEVMPLDDGANLEYVIRRTATSWAYVMRDDRGETTPSTNLCAACHERGGPDPFFRAPQTCPMNRNRR